MKKPLYLLFGLLIPCIGLSAQLSAVISDSTELGCFESADGSATVSISGGTAPYEILWNDDSLTTEATVTGLSADRWYRVTVTDADDAIAYDSIMLSQPDQLFYEIEGLKTIQCYGPAEGYLKISSGGGTGPHTYLWSGQVSSTSDSIYNLTAGWYYFQVTDSLACTLNDSLELEEADRVEIRIDSVFPNPCLGQQQGEIFITPEGGVTPYEYSWTGPSGFNSTLQDITGLKEGMYELILTDARGCAYEKDTSLVDGDPISVSYSVSVYGEFNLLCYGDENGSIRVDTVAGNGMDWKNYTYIWTGPGGFKAYTYELSDLKAGNYYLNVFDSLNCLSNETVVLTQPPRLGIRYDSVLTNPCINDETSAIYISITSGKEPFSYSWTGPEGFTSTSQDITGLAKGTYTLSVSDLDGCSSQSDTTLIQVENIDMVLTLSEYGEYNVSCAGYEDGMIKILSVPGYGDLSGFTFLTTGPDGFSSPFRFMTSGVKAGNYHIEITDPLGCSGEKDTVLTQPPEVQTGAIRGDARYVLDSNYLYTLEDTSGGSYYTWSVEGGEIWSGQGGNAVEIEWRSTGTGRVKVIETDQHGCPGDTVYLQTAFGTPAGLRPLIRKVKIFPNPASDVLHITGLDGMDGSIEIYSLLGQLVLRTKITGTLRLEELECGVYYLKVLDGREQPLLTRKIIKK